MGRFFGGNQSMQMYAKFEGFPISALCWEYNDLDRMVLCDGQKSGVHQLSCQILGPSEV